MTESDGLTAVLLQLQGLTQQLTELDHREASDVRQIQDRIAGLAALVSSIKDAAADQADILSWHAIVPFTFQIQVSHQTQE